MGLFDFLKKKESENSYSSPSASKAEVMAKCWAAVQAYQSRNFANAAKYFSEYFEMKGYGRFLDLDRDEYRMYMNLMLSQFYSNNYNECLKTCEKTIKLEPNMGDSYAFKAICLYKLGNESEANINWNKAKTKGCQLTEHFDTVQDVKMQGFND